MTTGSKKRKRRPVILATGVVAIGVIGGVIAANWNAFALSAAIVLAPQRPDLLRDARWEDPVSAKAFNTRFAAGTPVSGLLRWLDANEFTIDATQTRAERLISSLPCNERIAVTWSGTPDGKLAHAEATVSEAGCL